MALSDRLMKQLRKMEGHKNVVYDDATGARVVPGYTLKGHPTIGVGRCLDTHGITDHEVDILLNNDIDEVILICCKNFPWFEKLSEIRQSVICNMVFQMGLNGVMSFKNFLAAIQNEQWQNAYNAGMNSSWATQTPERAHYLMTTLLADMDAVYAV